MRHEQAQFGGVHGARPERHAVRYQCALSAVLRRQRLCLAYRPMCPWRG